MIRDTALYKFAKLYVLPWTELWDKAAKDVELVDATAEIKAAGYDANLFVRDIPIKPDGTIVGDLDAYKAKYATVFSPSVTPMAKPPIKATPVVITPAVTPSTVKTAAAVIEQVRTVIQPIMQAPAVVQTPTTMASPLLPAAAPMAAESGVPTWIYVVAGAVALGIIALSVGGQKKPKEVMA